MEIRDHRNKNWFWLDNEYLNGYAKHLGVSCTVVYLSLCRHANNKTQACHPSMELIAEENGIGSRNTVAKALKTLEEWGIIKIETAYNKKTKSRENNVYTLLAKSQWVEKPCTINEHGKRGAMHNECADPCTINDETHAQPVSSNKTYINKTNRTRLRNDVAQSEIFDKFWDKYPRKIDKKKAQKIWAKIDSSLYEKIIESVDGWVASEQWQDERYIPHPTTWLNNERWENTPEPRTTLEVLNLD